MQPDNSNDPAVDARYRTMLTLWFAMLMSVVMYAVFVLLANVRFFAPPVAANEKLSLLLVLAGASSVALSFLIKELMLSKAINSQQVASVQPAYIVSWALCEVSALLGVLIHFVAGSRYYFFAFIIAGLGIILHFPQKKHLLAASGQQF